MFIAKELQNKILQVFILKKLEGFDLRASAKADARETSPVRLSTHHYSIVVLFVK